MKKLVSILSITAVAMSLSTSAYASSQGVVERSVNFRSAPSTNSTTYGFLPKGTTFEVLDTYNKYWTKISANGKVGYVSDSYISITSAPAPSASPSSASPASTGTVTRSVNFRSAPSTNSTVYGLLRTGTAFEWLEQVNAYWVKISVNGQVGYVSSHYVDVSAAAPVESAPAPAPAPSPAPAPATSSTSVADRIIQHAMDLQGITHYAYGVNQAPDKLDCSSFTRYVFGQEGVSLRWGTRYQQSAGIAVSKSNLQKGDLVFFWTISSGKINHVGIYIGDGQFIHNTPSADGVTISSLTSGYWSSHYISARRVL